MFFRALLARAIADFERVFEHAMWEPIALKNAAAYQRMQRDYAFDLHAPGVIAGDPATSLAAGGSTSSVSAANGGGGGGGVEGSRPVSWPLTLTFTSAVTKISRTVKTFIEVGVWWSPGCLLGICCFVVARGAYVDHGRCLRVTTFNAPLIAEHVLVCRGPGGDGRVHSAVR